MLRLEVSPAGVNEGGPLPSAGEDKKSGGWGQGSYLVLP